MPPPNTTNQYPARSPEFIYGTAWKEDRTERLVSQAIKAGFRAIDTANQRRHYFEEGVGVALKKAYDQGFVVREDLFLQSKFTYQQGQDHRLPYDAKADVETQVSQSFASSLKHLNTDYLDAYLLHGPMLRFGLHDADLKVWKSMEQLVDEGMVREIGVSNVSAEQLTSLCSKARIKPSYVQNRCFASTRWDEGVRDICRQNHIRYQGFSLLTANIRELSGPTVVDIAKRMRVTQAQLVFAFAQQLGMIPLTGTSQPKHMSEDLASANFIVNEADMLRIKSIGCRNGGLH